MVSSASDRQAAPGTLERVRALLNTWLIPNDTRVPTDRFDEHANDRRVRGRDRTDLRRLRDDLRAAVEGHGRGEAALNSWLRRLAIVPAVRDGDLRFEPPRGAVGETLGFVLEAIADGRWHRLKACPDCRWVFYDQTRNASKRWCLMTAGGSDGRSCGSIDKVRRFRERRRVDGVATGGRSAR
jgi:predicted RNA-binding Zn ribbon-like protein